MIPSLNLNHVQIYRPQATGTIRKLLTHLEGDDYILAMDWSSINHFLSCWKKSEMALVNSRVSGRSAALTYGSAFHLVMEKYYLGERDLETLLTAAQPEFDANPPSIDEFRTPQMLRKAVVAYIAKYSDIDSFKIKTMPDGRPMVEQAFETPLAEIMVDGFLPYPSPMLMKAEDAAKVQSSHTKTYVRKLYVQWTGVIDILAEDMDSDVVIDHKTTSIGGPTYYDQFDLSQQFRGYCNSAAKITGRPCFKAMANVVEGRKETAKGKGTPLSFERKWMNYTPEQLATWEGDMIAIVQDFTSKLIAGHFPENTHSCVGKFGKCEYFDVCRLPQTMQPTLLQSQVFTDNVWNPLA